MVLVLLKKSSTSCVEERQINLLDLFLLALGGGGKVRLQTIKNKVNPWIVVGGVCNIKHKPMRYLHCHWTQVLSVHPTGVKGIAAPRRADRMLNRQSVRSR